MEILLYTILGFVTWNGIFDDVSAQTSCIISPDLTNLTIRDGLIRDTEFHCQCMDDNEIITGTRWFAGNTLVSQSNTSRPYSTTNTVPSRLIFSAPFTDADNGTYTCSPNDMFTTIPPGDAITLSAATPVLNPNRTCDIISTNLPILTTPGGVITNGTQNVILYCLCIQENVAVGPNCWFFNDVQINLTASDGSGAPYYRDNVPSPLIIPSFITGNDGTYHCGSMLGDIIPTPDDTITLLVPPMITISPPGPIQGAMVGSPQVINCTVSTVSGVESRIMISWIGPGGAITNDSRMTISPTTSSGNNYTSNLQFTYLMEGDEGTYTCNVTIFDTSESQSVEMQTLVHLGMKPTSQTSDCNDDNNITSIIFIVLFVISVMINILLIVVIIYFVLKSRKTNYSPNNVARVYDAVELQQQNIKSSTISDHEVPSVGSSTGKISSSTRSKQDIKADTVALQKNPSYIAIATNEFS